jgi:hypothetical protein
MALGIELGLFKLGGVASVVEEWRSGLRD